VINIWEKFKNSHESCQKFRNSQAHFLISEIANASHEKKIRATESQNSTTKLNV
jgi:hypothetical protein